MTLLAVASRLVRGTILKYETIAVIIALVVIYSYVFHRETVRNVFQRAHLISSGSPGTRVAPGKPVQAPLQQHDFLSPSFSFGSAERGPIQKEFREDNVAVYAIQGRRPRMEDRFDIVNDSQKTGVGFYGVFDGHGGEFAAEFSEKLLSQTVMARLSRGAKNGVRRNHSQILIEEILSLDEKFLTVARSNNDVAGTTALVALLTDKELIVANVGDSRGVMCDREGRTIPVSYDHKPHLAQERKRIKRAGGFITFNGVWRVAGVLATSRAIGDFPLKDRNFVIADPDIQIFNLEDSKPQFVILATDGLWDAFSNEEAVMYIKERLDEPHFGAKSIVLQAYYRGSLDNITVMVINFKARNGKNGIIVKKDDVKKNGFYKSKDV